QSTYTNTFGGVPLRFEPVIIEGNSAVIRVHTGDFSPGHEYCVRMEPGIFTDPAGNASPGIDPEQWRFKTKGASKNRDGGWVVASDGSGDFCTVQGAVDAIQTGSSTPSVIQLKRGTYDGLIRIAAGKNNIAIQGEDRHATIITGLNNDRTNGGTKNRALISVEANDFTLEN